MLVIWVTMHRLFEKRIDQCLVWDTLISESLKRFPTRFAFLKLNSFFIFFVIPSNQYQNHDITLYIQYQLVTFWGAPVKS